MRFNKNTPISLTRKDLKQLFKVSGYKRFDTFVSSYDKQKSKNIERMKRDYIENIKLINPEVKNKQFIHETKPKSIKLSKGDYKIISTKLDEQREKIYKDFRKTLKSKDIETLFNKNITIKELYKEKNTPPPPTETPFYGEKSKLDEIIDNQVFQKLEVPDFETTIPDGEVLTLEEDSYWMGKEKLKEFIDLELPKHVKEIVLHTGESLGLDYGKLETVIYDLIMQLNKHKIGSKFAFIWYFIITDSGQLVVDIETNIPFTQYIVNSPLIQ